MHLQLLFHPLASYCIKALIALYENGTPFERRIIDLGNPREREEFRALWPLAKFPVLRDLARGQTLPESSIIIEYLDRHYPGARPLIPLDPEQALQARLWDRFFDCYVHQPMQTLVSNLRRPESRQDTDSVAGADAMLRTAYGILDQHLAAGGWAGGHEFGLADCAAAPALFYSGTLVAFDEQPHLAAYFDRLSGRESFVRAIREAQPYFQLYPRRDAIPARFRDPQARSFSLSEPSRN
jgi:glutathione S-transferase